MKPLKKKLVLVTNGVSKEALKKKHTPEYIKYLLCKADGYTEMMAACAHKVVS